MKINFCSLANPSIRHLVPYQPSKTSEELERELGVTSSIELASNENPLGMGPKAILAAQIALSHGHIYPDGDLFELRQAIAHHLSVDAKQITIGNGSENILELLIKAYLSPNDTVIISQYVFLTIPILLKSYGAFIKVINAKNYGHDIAGMIQAIDQKTRILFLVNPNNPTGTYTHDRDFRRLMDSVPAHILIVVDEAYAEYMMTADYPNTLTYLTAYPNLVITRTFSKAYGLAGLRVGHAISSPEIADVLNRARLPFNVNRIAAKAASAALTDTDHLSKTLILNQHGMQQMQEGLKKLKLKYIPSVCNFITIHVSDATFIYQKLLQEGVIVRPLNAYEMPQHVRVTIGTMEQNERFLSTMLKVLQAN